jgi:hypothetical protein
MRPYLLAFFALLSLGGVATTASADDVAVSYLVDEKALKAAVAGTEVTFSLYADLACAVLLDAVPVNVEDLVIERVKLLRPKGAAKPPRVARLGATLLDVPAGGRHLTVTGTGIVPIGGACQAQAGTRPAARYLTVGTATTLEPAECAFVRVGGIASDLDAGDVIAFHMVDVNGDAIESFNNATVFIPGTRFLTSQSGTAASGQVCNPTNTPKEIPQGWNVVIRVL